MQEEVILGLKWTAADLPLSLFCSYVNEKDTDCFLTFEYEVLAPKGVEILGGGVPYLHMEISQDSCYHRN